MIAHRVMINGIEVNAGYSRQATEEIFLPLLRKLTALRMEKGRRILEVRIHHNHIIAF